MVFTYPTDVPFVTTKRPKMTRELTGEAKIIHDFYESHNFEIIADLSGKCEIIVTERNEEE